VWYTAYAVETWPYKSWTVGGYSRKQSEALFTLYTRRLLKEKAGMVAPEF